MEVGGVIDSGAGNLFKYRGADFGDANKVVKQGTYRGGLQNSNTPNNTQYGILCVFKADVYIFQLFFDPSIFYGRMSVDSGNSWLEWRNLL